MAQTDPHNEEQVMVGKENGNGKPVASRKSPADESRVGAELTGGWRELFNRLPEPELSQNGTTVLQNRYLARDEDGNLLETPKDMFFRVSRTVAEAEERYGVTEAEIIERTEQYYHLMAQRRFMPNSPTLMNAGREMGMLSACFVLPVQDSIDEIFDSVKATALIQKAGGGTGFAFDQLRPTGDFISSSGGRTSGPISFWKVFSEATNAIQQGAFRRGANMGMMSVEHPDILKFIYAKEDLQRFTNYNISVKITDAYMDALQRNGDAPLMVTNPRTKQRYYLPRDLDIETYSITNLWPEEEYQDAVETRRNDQGELETNVWTVGELFDVIVDNAWRTGEPGVCFIDRVAETNPTPHVGRMEATNPCGEQPLLPFEACNLGSLNLGIFAVSDEQNEGYRFDWEALRASVRTSVRFLDDVIDANQYPLPQIMEMCQSNRKIGLGVMGFADALFKLGIRYDSDEGVAFGEKVMKFINDEAHDASEELAEERGCFPNWEGSVWDTKMHRKMRNACSTTVAPTGTISILADCSGGIEPLFSLAFVRNVLDGKKLIEVNRYFKETALQHDFYSEELIEKLAEEGTLQHLSGVPQDAKHVFVCAHDIAPEWHIRMQSAFQRHNDSSISKTTNFATDATREQVQQIYKMAYEHKLKGVTVYRDGCRANQPMSLKKKQKKQQAEAAGDAAAEAVEEPGIPNIKPVSTPAILSAVRIRQRTPFGHMHLNLSVDPVSERELEVFAQLGKGGDVAASDLEAICRMVSLFLRSGGSLASVVDQLSGIGSHLTVPTREGRIMSLGDGIARALEKYLVAKRTYGLKAILLGEVDPNELPNLKNGEVAKPKDEKKPKSNITTTTQTNLRKQDRHNTLFKLACPNCQDSVLVFEEGCKKCYACGYSEC